VNGVTEVNHQLTDMRRGGQADFRQPKLPADSDRYPKNSAFRAKTGETT
jgi:hypothetical protein